MNRITPRMTVSLVLWSRSQMSGRLRWSMDWRLEPWGGWLVSPMVKSRPLLVLFPIEQTSRLLLWIAGFPHIVSDFLQSV